MTVNLRRRCAPSTSSPLPLRERSDRLIRAADQSETSAVLPAVPAQPPTRSPSSSPTQRLPSPRYAAMKRCPRSCVYLSDGTTITTTLIVIRGAAVLFSLIGGTAYFLGWKLPCAHIRKAVCTNCGHLTNSSYESISISGVSLCCLRGPAALPIHRDFSVDRVDEYFQRHCRRPYRQGNAIEVLYPTGMFTRA
jgi:hypothetical protein